jgi:tRNA-Thr(GGU) m(6)t(6)A37 methyltransferase TsaA
VCDALLVTSSDPRYELRMPGVHLTPIGTVHSTRSAPDDDDWDAESASIELDPALFTPEALAGLETFSHVEVVYVFDRVEPEKIERGARHPRNNLAWPKVGIFAQRGKNRPNRLGTTICRIDRVEGVRVHVTGLDAIDGTPVLDLKPWVREFGPRGDVRQPAWIDELMVDYWSAARQNDRSR